MKTAPLVLLLSLVLTLVLCVSAAATWSHDPSENEPVCTHPDEQGNPSLAPDGGGGVYVVWDERRGGSYDVFAHHLNAAGDLAEEPEWPVNGMPVCEETSYKAEPTAIPDGSEGVYVLWRDARSGVWRTHYQRIAAGGTYMLDPYGVAVCSDTSAQSRYRVVSDGGHGFIVVWEDLRAGSGDANIYAQRVGASGLPVWDPAGVPICTASGGQFLHDVASDGAGGALVAWDDDSEAPGNPKIYVQRIDGEGAVKWTPNGVAVCTETGWRSGIVVENDGVGGAVLAWRDERAGNTDIYAQRVSPAGYAMWTADGIAVRASSYDEYTPSIIDDGDAGVIVTWLDGRANPGERDIYAQRVDRYGNLVWDSAGKPVCTAGTYFEAPVLVSDGAGGVIAVWEDYRDWGSHSYVYAQRLDASGGQVWDPDGLAVSLQGDDHQDLDVAADGSGGVIAAWRLGDGENLEGDIFAQRLERNGYLGFPSPSLYEVADCPDDQGGMVVVSWYPSYLDDYPHEVVTDYSVWRRIPVEEGARGREKVDVEELSAEIGLYSGAVESYLRSGWSYVGNVDASYWDSYGCDAPTYGDSGTGVPTTDYMVVAQTADQWVFWQSLPLGGYSVDNLTPGAPVALAALSVEVDVELSWSPSGVDDEDLDFYNVYRSASSGFTPDAGTFIGTSPDTLFTDAAPGYGTWYYLVTAEDVHGNESGPSNEAAAGSSTGVDETPAAFALRGCHPNPFNPATVVSYDVPKPGGKVSIEVFDLRGRLVRTLLDGVKPPGRRRVAWMGTDSNGQAVSSGVYFCRMTADGYERTAKLTLLK